MNRRRARTPAPWARRRSCRAGNTRTGSSSDHTARRCTAPQRSPDRPRTRRTRRRRSRTSRLPGRCDTLRVGRGSRCTRPPRTRPAHIAGPPGTFRRTPSPGHMRRCRCWARRSRPGGSTRSCTCTSEARHRSPPHPPRPGPRTSPPHNAPGCCSARTPHRPRRTRSARCPRRTPSLMRSSRHTSSGRRAAGNHTEKRPPARGSTACRAHSDSAPTARPTITRGNSSHGTARRRFLCQDAARCVASPSSLSPSPSPAPAVAVVEAPSPAASESS